MVSIDVGPLLTKVLNFEGLNALGPHFGYPNSIPSSLGFFNYVELSCGQTAGMAMGTPLFLSLLTSETGLA
jgi:hypothetical protein